MRKQIILLLALSSLSIQLSGQVFSSDDEITILIDPIKGKYYEHELKSNQTIYRLAKFFRCSVNDVYDLNGIKANHSYTKGDIILFPFNPKFLLKEEKKTIYRNVSLLPVYYHVAPKDNLYRISNVFFDQEIEQLMHRNGLKNSELSIDQRLLVGWMPIPKSVEDKDAAKFKKMIAPFTLEKVNQKVEEVTRVKTENTSHNPAEELVDSTIVLDVEENIEMDSTMLKLKNRLYGSDVVDSVAVVHTDKGIAIWNKDHRDQESLYVLHKSAKVNSIIELHYPLLHRKAFAKVVGNIPDGVYPDDVSLIISPKVAQSLGARDTRFAIEMKYYE